MNGRQALDLFYRRYAIKMNLLRLLIAMLALFSSSLVTTYTLAALIGGVSLLALGFIAPIFVLSVLIAMVSLVAALLFLFQIIAWA